MARPLAAHGRPPERLPLYTVACHDDLTAADLVGRHLISRQRARLVRRPADPRRARRRHLLSRRSGRGAQDTTVVLHPLAMTAASCPSIAPASAGGTCQFHAGRFLQPGYQNLLKGLKPSTRQRFVSMSFDFPSSEREVSILIGETGCDADLAKRLVGIAKAFRALKDRDLEEVASTRLLVHAAT